MIRILRRVLFFVAFTVYLLVQVMLVGVIPAYYWPSRTGFILFLVGLLLSGACGYIVHRRITRERYNYTEAEKWLTLRTRPCIDHTRRVKAAKRWAIWIPTAIVVIAFLFFPETWAIVSHLSHPGSGRLLGYRVSIPANWVVLTDEPDIGSSHTWSSVAAFHSKGVLRAGAPAYWRREPPIWLREHEDDDIQFIACATPQNDFYGWFDGDKASVTGFYRTLQNVRQTN